MNANDDGLAHSCAMIQYKVDMHDELDFACRQNHVCFYFESGRSENPRKRLRAGFDSEDRFCYATSNARIALQNTTGPPKVLGICAAESPLSSDEMRASPSMSRRITVQASGVATLIVPSKLDSSIKVGTYIGVDTSDVIATDDLYAVFKIVRVKPFFNAHLVIGRVCNVKSLATGFTELSILLTLQLKPPPQVLPASVTRDEASLMDAYVPPTLLHTIWAFITPTASDERASDMAEVESLDVFKKAAAQAREQNLPMVASTLENAIFEKQKDASYVTEFPAVEQMSSIGMHAFLIGNRYTKGVLWFFKGLKQVKTSIPLIMRHRPVNEAPGGGGMASASMFKSDEEMKAIQSFLAWSKSHAEHIQEPLFENVIGNLTSKDIHPT